MALHHYVNLDKETPTTMAFTPDGSELLVGTANPNSVTILVLDYDNGLEHKSTQNPLKLSDKKGAITNMIISDDGMWFAAMDNEKNVSLMKKGQLGQQPGQALDPSKPIEWIFNGKIKSHEVAITDIAFGQSLDENM